jgi:hypothetical protein
MNTQRSVVSILSHHNYYIVQIKLLRSRMHGYLLLGYLPPGVLMVERVSSLGQADLPNINRFVAIIPTLFCLSFGLRPPTCNSANISRSRGRNKLLSCHLWGKFAIALPISLCVDNPLGPSNDWYSITSHTTSVSSSFDSLSGCVGWIGCCPPLLCCRRQAVPTLASFQKRIPLYSFGCALKLNNVF